MPVVVNRLRALPRLRLMRSSGERVPRDRRPYLILSVSFGLLPSWFLNKVKK